MIVQTKKISKLLSTFKLFISYRRQDSEDVTGRLYDRLKSDLDDAQLFMDIDDIPLGLDFRHVIEQQVSQCDVLLAVIGRDWLTLQTSDGIPRIDDPMDYVRLEILAALQRNIPVIPVLVKQAPMPLVNQLPKELANLAYRNGIQLESGRHFHSHAHRLIQDLKHLKQHLSVHQPQTPDPSSSKGSERASQVALPEKKSFEPEMVLVPAGRFDRGDIQGTGGAEERPVDKVEIKPGFWVGKYPVTVAEFKAYVQRTGVKTEAEQNDGAWVWDGTQFGKDKKAYWQQPGFSQSDDHPVVCVSFHDVLAYIDWLKQQTGKPYRLLTEAQWEYACRGGTDSDYHWGNELDESQAAYGAYNESTKYRSTVKVGSFKPNDFGLYDMHGNVWEWCEDMWHEDYQGAPLDGSAWLKNPTLLDLGGKKKEIARVVRGGSWVCRPEWLRASARNWIRPVDRGADLGFRLAQDTRA